MPTASTTRHRGTHLHPPPGRSYKYTLEDIKRRAAENRSRGAVLGTYAQAKSRLELQITKAQQNGDEEEVERWGCRGGRAVRGFIC